MKQQIAFLFLTFICTITPIKAQINGLLVDTTSQEPISYATIALYNKKDNSLVNGTMTNELGIFKLNGIKKGSYYIKASFIGYTTKAIEGILIVKNNESVSLGTIALSPSEMLLKEVVVLGEKSNILHKVDRQVYDAKKFQSSVGGNAVDVIKNLPSVAINGLGEISVRGTTGFVVLLNGKPIQGKASTILSQLPANLIKNVEVITAPSAKYDSEGKAGILNITTTKGAVDGTFTQINIKAGLPSIEDYDNKENAQRYGADITYNYKNEKWNVSLGGNYQRNDKAGRREGDVYTIINDVMTQFPSDGERSFDELNYSGSFTLDYTPNVSNNLSLGFYAGKRSKDRTADIVYYDNHAISPVVGGNRIYTFQYYNENLRIRKGDFVLGSVDYNHKFSNDAKLSTSFLYEYTLLGGPTNNDNLGYPNTSIILQNEYNTNDNPLHGTRFQIDYALAPQDFGLLELGYQYRNLTHEGDFIYERLNNNSGLFELVPEFSSEVDLERQIHAAYAQLSKSNNILDYNLGVRTEAMDRKFDLRDKTGIIDTTYTYDFVKLFPSASIQFKIKNKVKLKAAYSKRIQRTTTFKMNSFPEREHSETLEQGDPTLLPEFIDLAEIGLIKDFKGSNSFFATAYFRNTKNLVNRVNTIYNDTILNRIYSNVGTGKSVGIEIGSQNKLSDKWSNFIGANVYNNSINGTFDNKPIDSKSWIYSINLNSTYSFSPTTNIQFTFNYLSDRNTAQGEDSRFYSPNLSFKKTFFDNRLVATLQWQHMDLGLLDSNEQRITTSRPNEFYTTTNYVYEVDMVLLNLSYSFNKTKNKAKFIKSEFGQREF